MYTNRIGMLVKADFATIVMTEEELQSALTVVINRQLGNQFDLQVMVDDEDTVMLNVDGNPANKLDELKDGGYGNGGYSDLQQAVSLLFEIPMKIDQLRYDPIKQEININIPFEVFIQKTFGIE